MRGLPELKIQSALLLVIVPVLFLVTSLAGYLVYSSLYSDILAGFDARLRSVSTVTAAFVEAEEHSQILRPVELTALAFDPETGRLLGADDDGRLFEIDRKTGSAQQTARLDIRVLDLTWEPERRQLLGLEASGNRLRLIDPQTGASREVLELAGSFQALGRDPATGLVYAAGATLTTIDSRNWTALRTREIGGEGPLSLSGGKEPGILYGTLSESSEILRIDVRRDRPEITRIPFQLSDPDPDGTALQDSVEAVTLRFLAFDPAQDLFWTGDDRLARLEAGGTRLEVSGYPGFRNEQSPLYQKFVLPMRRIKQRVNLTYLYTFVLDHQDREIVYGLDANTDEDHSNIGDIDSDPPEEGTVRVFHQGGVHLSDIEFWEQWGLIKSADAAVYDRQGDVRAIAGSDINISIIRQKTRSALFNVCLIGLLCLGFASLAAVKVSHRLVRPIERLKSEALKVAAGQFGERVQVDSPTELQELAQSFNDMSADLKSTLEGLTESNRNLEQERRRTELILALASRTDCDRPGPETCCLCGRTNAHPTSRDSSGWVMASGRLFVWFVDPSPQDAFDAVRFRSDLATTFRHLLDSPQGEWNLILRFFEPLFRPSLRALVQVEVRTGTCRLSVRGELPAVRISADGTLTCLRLRGEEVPELAEGEGLLLTAPHLVEHLPAASIGQDPSVFRDENRLRDLLASVASAIDHPDRDSAFLSVWRPS